MEESIWQAKLDSIYQCQVTRLNERQGQLSVLNESTGETLLNATVPLAYGAAFGPDIAGVASWQDMCVSVVDKQ